MGIVTEVTIIIIIIIFFFNNYKSSKNKAKLCRVAQMHHIEKQRSLPGVLFQALFPPKPFRETTILTFNSIV